MIVVGMIMIMVIALIWFWSMINERWCLCWQDGYDCRYENLPNVDEQGLSVLKTQINVRCPSLWQNVIMLDLWKC